MRDVDEICYVLREEKNVNRRKRKRKRKEVQPLEYIRNMYILIQCNVMYYYFLFISFIYSGII